MAKGQIFKAEVLKRIVDVFGDDAFLYNDGKELRINGQEDGEEVQIKVTLTAAKTPVIPGSDTEIPTSKCVETITNKAFEENNKVQPTATFVQPTEEEKKNLQEMLSRLGL